MAILPNSKAKNLIITVFLITVFCAVPFNPVKYATNLLSPTPLDNLSKRGESLTGIGALFNGVNYILAQISIEFLNIQVENIDGKTVKIKWSTNIESDGKILYGKSSDNLNCYLIDNRGLLKYHEMLVGNLESDTIYYFQIIASNNSERVYSFIRDFDTEEYHDKIAPKTSDLRVAYISGTVAAIEWQTDEEATSVVEYDQLETYKKSASSRTKITDHQIILRNLTPNIRYYIRVYSVDKDNNKSSYYYKEFTTYSTDQSKEDLVISYLRPSGPDDSNITDKSVTVSFKTNHWAKGSVKLTKRGHKTQTKNLDYSSNHQAVFDGLFSDSEYTLIISMKDIFNKKAEVKNYIIRTAEVSLVIDDSGLGNFVSLNNEISFGPIFYTSYDNGFKPDIAGGSYNFLKISDAKLGSGKFGQAAKIEGDSQIGYSRTGNFNIESGTIAFWLNSSYDSDNDKNYILFNLNSGYAKAADKYFLIGKMTRKELKIHNKLAFGMEDSRDTDYWCYINDDLLANKWYFVVATWSYGGNYKLYIDGSDNNLAYYKENRNLGNAPKFGADFYVGAENEYFKSSSDYLIDEVMIFNRVLSDNEVSQLFDGSLNFNVGSGDIDNDKVIVEGAEFSYYTPASELYRTSDSPDIYAITNGQRHYISSPASFREHGYSWADIKTVSWPELSQYPRARLIKSPDSPTIYYLYQRPEGQWLKIAIPSPTAFVSYSENFWGNVITVTQTDIDNYPDVKLIKTADDPAVYYLESNVKHFISKQVFEQCDFSIPEIVEVSQVHLDTYKTGLPLK